MQHQKQLVVEMPDDALAEARKLLDAPAHEFAQRRIDAAQQKRAGKLGLVEHLALDARPQPLEVNRNVGQLGHGCPPVSPSS